MRIPEYVDAKDGGVGRAPVGSGAVVEDGGEGKSVGVGQEFADAFVGELTCHGEESSGQELYDLSLSN
jgi:hypothetical protein